MTEEGAAYQMTRGSKANPRYTNGNKRRKHRARFKALGLPCAICGRPIHYDEPSNSDHPLSFVIDEIIPVSRWQQFGYSSPQEAAQDWNNLQPCHYLCNARKGNKLNFDLQNNVVGGGSPDLKKRIFFSDGEW